jgi:hypothetical protein
MKQPTFAHALRNFSGHLELIFKLNPRNREAGFNFYDGVSVTIKITEVASEDDYGSLAAEYHIYSMNDEVVGNKHNTVKRYTELCTPILEKIALGKEVT